MDGTKWGIRVLNLKERIKSASDKKLHNKEIVNVLLYSIILLMPFIVTDVSGPRYVVGKMFFLYIITCIALIFNIGVRAY